MSACVSCGGPLKSQRVYQFASKRFHQVYAGEGVLRCSACNLSQVDVEQVNNDLLTSYYQQDYRVVAGAGSRTDVSEQWFRKRAVALADLAMAQRPQGATTAFEVGAGYGYNLLELAQRFPGIQMWTDEVSQAALTGMDNRIAHGNLADRTYDIIIMSHVLEHFADPKALMAEVAAALNPGGVAIIEVPNDVDGIERLNGPDEPHLTFFEQPTLRKLLEQSGLEVVTVEPAGPTFQRTGLKRALRKGLRKALYLLPVVSGALTRRAAQSVAGNDSFGLSNPQGVFLRAVLRKP